jgi:hypothetical protein
VVGEPGVRPVALGLITISVGPDDGHRIMRKPGAHGVAAIHEQTALAELAIAVHGITLLGDAFPRPESRESRSRARSTTGRCGRASASRGYLAAALGLSFPSASRSARSCGGARTG